MLSLGLELGKVIEIWLPDGRLLEVKYVERRSMGRIRLGFTGPKDVGIYRKCIADDKRRQMRMEAAGRRR